MDNAQSSNLTKYGPYKFDLKCLSDSTRTQAGLLFGGTGMSWDFPALTKWNFRSFSPLLPDV